MDGHVKTIFKIFFRFSAYATGSVAILILVFMIVSGLPLIISGGLISTLTGPWSPQNELFGIYPMIRASIGLSIVAVMIAFPLSFSTSAFSLLISKKGYGQIIKRWITMMTGIPTVIYGFIGVILIVPLFRSIYISGTGGTSGYSILTAATVLAIMISPTMILIITESFETKSELFRKIGLAAGADDFQIFLHVILPVSFKSLVAALVLGIGRAAGDTLIALMLAGNSAAADFSLTSPARTLTSHIALIMNSDFESLAFKSVFMCGAVLYCFSGMSIIVIRTLLKEKDHGRN